MKTLLALIVSALSIGASAQTIYTPSTNGTPGFVPIIQIPSLIVGNVTNTPSFTLVNTNWGDGGTYTNLTGRTIYVWTPCSITETAVAGSASYRLVITGVTTNIFGGSTSVTSIASSLTNSVFGYVAPGGTFTFTNISAGAGNSAAIVKGGQYMVF